MGGYVGFSGCKIYMWVWKNVGLISWFWRMWDGDIYM